MELTIDQQMPDTANILLSKVKPELGGNIDRILK